jgi:hypothetical protein
MHSLRSLFLVLLLSSVTAFAPQRSGSWAVQKKASTASSTHYRYSAAVPLLHMSNSDGSGSSSLKESDQTLLGVAGTGAALLTLYSEYTLKTTGCGLPAGPLGLLGAAEGISYLGVIGLVAYSLYTKFRTGSGLPAGPGGLLGAAEGLSFLAIAAGLVVLAFQILDYGYIPNAVPMEGGMCS